MELREQADLSDPLHPHNKLLIALLANKNIHKKSYPVVIACFGLAAIIFFAVSIFMMAVMSQVTSVNVLYASQNDQPCPVNSTCSVSFQIGQYMQAPIYVLYQLKGFRQNQKQYVQSKNTDQLNGVTIGNSQARFCSPYITNSDMGLTMSWGNQTLGSTQVASPCGTVAYTLFNDTFALSLNGQPISIAQDGISWPGDAGGVFKQTSASQQTQWTNPQSQHFAVWMRLAGLSDFSKLWGRITTNLNPGNYTMQIASNYNLGQWQGQKYFTLTTNSAVGGKNFLLPVLMLLTSVACIVAAILIILRAKQYRKYVVRVQN